ncbi:hypothetical protein E1264_11095 [Actinomadura sp. KC216]|uniref:hypothetical protein n=1 Tax=Actinomadura sp. KC216 TaxID=2530370 RepID=UPI00104FD18E|nr:hypothetical protein [Actinomadura sp. KC216]TDB88488.1 hypothetical protein E1264_11095 [Actinomadura sp. KC216]
MGSRDRALPLKARGSRRTAGVRDGELPDGPAEHKRETEEYARQAMVSSARAHDRAAILLERMATADPEEAELHLQSAARHRRWAENDRKLAEQYATRSGDPDGL